MAILNILSFFFFLVGMLSSIFFPPMYMVEWVYMKSVLQGNTLPWIYYIIQCLVKCKWLQCLFCRLLLPKLLSWVKLSIWLHSLIFLCCACFCECLKIKSGCSLWSKRKIWMHSLQQCRAQTTDGAGVVVFWSLYFPLSSYSISRMFRYACCSWQFKLWINSHSPSSNPPWSKFPVTHMDGPLWTRQMVGK